MSTIGYDGLVAGFARRLRLLVRSPADGRVRAAWRVLLAWPVLWVLTGSVLFSSATAAAGGPTVLRVTGSIPGLLGVVDGYGFPRLVIACLLLRGWLRWRRGALPAWDGIAQWDDR